MIWCFKPGLCSDLNTDEIEKTEPAKVQEVYHFYHGILMSIGESYLVIDDHYVKKAAGFKTETYTTGKKIWFRQNKRGEIVEILETLQ